MFILHTALDYGTQFYVLENSRVDSWF